MYLDVKELYASLAAPDAREPKKPASTDVPLIDEGLRLDADDANLAAYVKADPINFADPTGMLRQGTEKTLSESHNINPTFNDIIITAQLPVKPPFFPGFGALLSMPPENGYVPNSDADGDGRPDPDIEVTAKRSKPGNPLTVGPLYHAPPAPSRESKKDVSDFCGSRGSSRVPDKVVGTDISGACASHDSCYGSSTSQAACDGQLMRDIWAECRRQSRTTGCYAAGIIYYFALRFFGETAYQNAQKARRPRP